MNFKSYVCGAALAAFAFAPALAQAPVKIGMITTLSGPGGYLGQDVRDAFKLAIEMEGGKLGGVPVQLLVEDDALKPGQGKQIADTLHEDRARQAAHRHRLLERRAARSCPTFSTTAAFT